MTSILFCLPLIRPPRSGLSAAFAQPSDSPVDS
ncbi:hypothetical protein HNP46_002876 [Pseudomonas nitritireducens]|uniref:Uncharacterized protein n=1 Tax=Pseudomonas nitroreducens TaxID=46680 RepID=A0A7W7KK93_PSENT|nr:hypothetical protein [Pseudomonas nitritireducens]